MNASWYDILDVDPTATADEIRAAWRHAVADLDPTDRRFRVLNQAAEGLLDPQKRVTYDAELAAAVAEATAERRPGPFRRPIVPGWVLVAVAAVTAGVVVVVGVLLSQPSDASVQGDTEAAQAAAERAIVPILSYDAHRLDQSRAKATPYLTDSERAEYDKLFAVIRQNAPRTGTVVHAQYVASGIVRSGPGRVDVLVFVDQKTLNKQHPKVPVIYKNQVTVSMEKVGNDWLVDHLTTNTG